MFRRLVAGLNLKQKNEAKLGGEALVSHWFGNESNQIVLGVNDGDDESLARAQLAGFVKEKGMRLVFPEPNTPSLSNTEPLVMEGRAGSNYARTDASQVLVRLPVGAAEELLNAVGYSVTGRRPIQMTVGPLVANGLEESRSLARQMRRPAISGPKMLIDELASSRRAGEERAEVGPRYAYGVNGNAVVVGELGRSTSGATGVTEAATAMAKKVDGSDVGTPYRPMSPDGREVADAAGESRAGVSGVIYRLLGVGTEPVREKAGRLGFETDARKDAEGKSEPAPGVCRRHRKPR
jgi:hypothetical protein